MIEKLRYTQWPENRSKNLNNNQLEHKARTAESDFEPFKEDDGRGQPHFLRVGFSRFNFCQFWSFIVVSAHHARTYTSTTDSRTTALTSIL